MIGKAIDLSADQLVWATPTAITSITDRLTLNVLLSFAQFEREVELLGQVAGVAEGAEARIEGRVDVALAEEVEALKAGGPPSSPASPPKATLPFSIA